MADSFDDLLKKIIKDAVYEEKAKVDYKFDPYNFNSSDYFNFNDSFRIFNKGECVNCKHYICSEETKCYKDADGVTVYGCVLCPGCLKGRSVLSTEKTRFCYDFERLIK